MAAERGQRTRLMFGGVSAEVSLLNTSGKPRDAQHETKRVLAQPVPPEGGVVGPPEPLAATFPNAGDTRDALEAAVDRGDTAALESYRQTGAPVADPALPPGVEGDGVTVENVEVSPAQRPTGVVPTATFKDEAQHVPDHVWDQVPVQPDTMTISTPDHPPSDGDGLRARDQAEQLREALHGPVRVTVDLDGRRVGSALSEPDPMGDETPTPVPPATPAATNRMREYEQATAESLSAPEYKPPATVVQQGVHTPSGEWVDLTRQLAEIDERTRIEGLEVVATIASSSIPRERVRGAKYIAGVNPNEYKVLALLWHALRGQNRAAAVRYTKKTAQTLGIIVARGTLDEGAHLLLLEIEWHQNWRAPSPRVLGPILRPVTDAEVNAATELVESFAGTRADVNELRDERLAKRAELLELARAGKLDEYESPAEPMPDDVVSDADGIAEALLAAAAWIKAHAAA